MFIGEDSLFMNAKTKEDEFFGLIKPDDKNREIKIEILNSCKQVYSAMGCTPETTFKWDIETMFNRINNTKVKFTWATRESAVPVTHCHELYKVECMEMLYQAYENNNITCQYKPHVDLIPNEEENILLQKIPKSTPDYPRAKPFSGTKVRIAYSILVHGNTEMFARLMRLLYHPDNFYSLCIDKSVDDNEYETFKKIAEKYSVYIIPERFDVMWGHPTLMYAQYISLLALMDLGEWDYFINLSGVITADLPLKSQPEISDFLVKNMGMSFMHNRKLINGDLIEAGELYITCIEDQIDFPHMILDGNIPYGNIHPPHNFTWYFGWNWMILSKNATLFLKYHPFSHDVIRKSKYIYIADEKTFHTILKNAPELEGLIDINYHRYINWTLNAHVIIPEYLPIIQNENQTDLFARKFKNDAVAVQFENWFIENKETFTP